MKDCLKLDYQSKTHPLQENIQTIQRLRNIVIFGETLTTSLTLGRWLALILIKTTLTKLRSIQIPVRAEDRGLLWDEHRRLCLYCRTRTLERSGHADHWQLWTQPGTGVAKHRYCSHAIIFFIIFKPHHSVQSKAQMGMWCMLAAPLIMSNDLRTLRLNF